jgi:hypothetical protein
MVIFIWSYSYAADIAVPNTFQAGTPAKAEEVNQNFSTVYDEVNGINFTLNGNITNQNISPDAQIDQSKIQGGPFAAQNHSHTPIIWSGGCSQHGTVNGVNKYCADGVEFNTASQHLSVNTDGTFTALIPGFYKVNAFAASQAQTGTMVQARLTVNGKYIYDGVQTSASSGWHQNVIDATWPLNTGDIFWVEYYYPCSGCYAYHRWQPDNNIYSRLQVTYLGPKP